MVLKLVIKYLLGYSNRTVAVHHVDIMYHVWHALGGDKDNLLPMLEDKDVDEMYSHTHTHT